MDNLQDIKFTDQNIANPPSTLGGSISKEGNFHVYKVEIYVIAKVPLEKL